MVCHKAALGLRVIFLVFICLSVCQVFLFPLFFALLLFNKCVFRTTLYLRRFIVCVFDLQPTGLDFVVM